MFNKTFWLSFLGVLILSLPTWAAIGPRKSIPTQIRKIIWPIDLRFSTKSIVCSAVAIGPKHLLTAAHCLPRTAFLKCPNFGRESTTLRAQTHDHCPRIRVGKTLYRNFRVTPHPEYRNRSGKMKYLETSNNDVAIIRLPQPVFKDFQDSRTITNQLSPPRSAHGSSRVFYGYGMSRVELGGHKAPFMERRRGLLKGTSIGPITPKSGLLITQESVMAARHNSVSDVAIQGAGQILRSDSGGPLYSGPFLIGLARNYKVVERTDVKPKVADHKIAGRMDSKTHRHFRIQSTFTDLRHPAIRRFLRTSQELLPRSSQ